MNKKTDYVRYDELSDVICSVQLAADLAQFIPKHPTLWKWLIIVAHNALQGAMVCTLSDTHGVGALTKLSRVEMLNYLQDDREQDPPREFLDDYSSLLKRVQQQRATIDGAPLRLSATQQTWLKTLNELRCDFVHFTPKGWSIETAGLPQITIAALDAIEQLMIAQDRLVVRMSDNQKRTLERAIEKARAALVKISSEGESSQ